MHIKPFYNYEGKSAYTAAPNKLILLLQKIINNLIITYLHAKKIKIKKIDKKLTLLNIIHGTNIKGKQSIKKKMHYVSRST